MSTSPDTMPVPQTAAEAIAACREQGLAEPEKVARASWPELFAEHSKHTAPTMREALEQIEAIETDYTAGSDANLERARSIARAALSQAEPGPSEPKDEPVAWRWRIDGEQTWQLSKAKPVRRKGVPTSHVKVQIEPLYTYPALPDREAIARIIEECSHDITRPRFFKDRLNAARACVDSILKLMEGR